MAQILLLFWAWISLIQLNQCSLNDIASIVLYYMVHKITSATIHICNCPSDKTTAIICIQCMYIVLRYMGTKSITIASSQYQLKQYRDSRLTKNNNKRLILCRSNKPLNTWIARTSIWYSTSKQTNTIS